MDAHPGQSGGSDYLQRLIHLGAQGGFWMAPGMLLGILLGDDASGCLWVSLEALERLLLVSAGRFLSDSWNASV